MHRKADTQVGCGFTRGFRLREAYLTPGVNSLVLRCGYGIMRGFRFREAYLTPGPDRLGIRAWTAFRSLAADVVMSRTNILIAI